ncbi:MAG: hypothetical protein K2O78_00150 [Muribaculaceae bacterium]|nr:hypothetical protein [Muribaculaceae bacterium]
MNHDFTAAIKAWLDADPQERSFEKGATMLLQLTGNRILYANLMADPLSRLPFLEHELQKYYDFRVLDLTHDQVRDMERQVDAIADSLALGEDSPQDSDRKAERLLGRRPDHDSLPDDVIARYTENYSILQRMRELHVRLRMLTLTDHPCPDSERYPFLRDLIALDRRLHENWKVYDTFTAAADSSLSGARSEATPAKAEPPKATPAKAQHKEA